LIDFLDTNMVIYLIENPPLFGARAAALITGLIAAGHTFAVSDLVRLECRVLPIRAADAITYQGGFILKRLQFKIGDGVWSDTDTVADEVQVNFRVVKIEIGIIPFSQRIRNIKDPRLCLEGHPKSRTDKGIVQVVSRHIIL